MSERMSEHISDTISENMPERISEDCFSQSAKLNATQRISGDELVVYLKKSNVGNIKSNVAVLKCLTHPLMMSLILKLITVFGPTLKPPSLHKFPLKNKHPWRMSGKMILYNSRTQPVLPSISFSLKSTKLLLWWKHISRQIPMRLSPPSPPPTPGLA